MRTNWIITVMALLLLVAPVKGISQVKLTNATVSGFVVDAEDGSEISNAFVLLLDAKKKVLKQAQTDEHGRFTFQEIGSGSYYFRLVMVGYPIKISKPIQIVDATRKYNFRLALAKPDKGDAAVVFDYGEYFDLLEDQSDLIQEK